MSFYGGFPKLDMEGKYNITVFDLILTLGARVAGTLRNSKLKSLVTLFCRDL